MAVPTADLNMLQRQRNAAALHDYLRQTSPPGFGLGPADLLAMAGEIERELSGGPDVVNLAREAWAGLILSGPVIADLRLDDGHAWRLVDAQKSPFADRENTVSSEA